MPNRYEDPADYAADAPHNSGLPSLTWRRPDKNSKTGLESLKSDWYGKYMAGYKGRYKLSNNEETIDTAPIGDTKRAPAVPEDLVRRRIEALRAAKEKGYAIPKEMLDPTFLTALLIKEGRPDFGGSADFFHNKTAVKLYNDLVERFGNAPASFAAGVLDKGQVAQRTKKPFPMVWNGTGEVRDEKGNLLTSGQNYAQNFPLFMQAAQHPENKDLYGFVNSIVNSNTYTTPIPKSTRDKIDFDYQRRKTDAALGALKKLEPGSLRSLQYGIFGGSNNLLGVPKEYDPQAMEASVAAPDYEALRKQLDPTYKRGGAIENTTRKKKIL